jgi:hypothetical protein
MQGISHRFFHNGHLGESFRSLFGGIGDNFGGWTRRGIGLV